MNINDIFVIYGENPTSLAHELIERSGFLEQWPKTASIALKPNLVTASPAQHGATTHPEIAGGIITALRDRGFSRISIMEGSWIGARTSSAFKACGYSALAEKHGITIIDTQTDKYERVTVKDMVFEISKSALEADVIINLPVLKGHCQTNMTCALKNLKGLISNAEKRRFHTMGLHMPIALLASYIRPQLTIVDGICGDLNFEEGGNPVTHNRMLMACDPVLLDAYCASLIGFSVSDVPYIGLAAEYGAGSCDISSANVISINEPLRPVGMASPSGRAKRLGQYVAEKGACSACYAGLINALDRLDSAGRLSDKFRFSIGQDFKDSSGEGIGIGNCCSGFKNCIKGCPVNGIDIVNYINRQ